jgi:hypothetical protein
VNACVRGEAADAAVPEWVVYFDRGPKPGRVAFADPGALFGARRVRGYDRDDE